VVAVEVVVLGSTPPRPPAVVLATVWPKMDPPAAPAAPPPSPNIPAPPVAAAVDPEVF